MGRAKQLLTAAAVAICAIVAAVAIKQRLLVADGGAVQSALASLPKQAAPKVGPWWPYEVHPVMAQLAAQTPASLPIDAECAGSDVFDVEAAGRTCREQVLPFLTRDGSRIQGFHVLCVIVRSCTYAVFPFWKGGRDFAGLDGASDADYIEVDRRGGARGAFKTLLAAEPRLRFLGHAKRAGLKQRGSLFTADGYRREPTTLPAGLSLAFEGGQFIWPGVEIGFSRRVNVTSPTSSWKRSLELKTLSMVPLVIAVSSFLTESECAHIIGFSAPNMAASGVSLMDKDKGKKATEWRTSTTFFMRSRDSAQLAEIDWRVASVTRLPRSHQEDLQVLRYEKTQRYVSHHDFFAPHLYKGSPETMHLIQNGHRNRLVTVFWYMSDVAEGGSTVFPRAIGHNPDNHAAFGSCDPNVGLHVKPQRGKIILFYSMLPNGGMADESLHGGCPVVNGTKWAANKWVWNKPVRDASDNYNPR
jgi:prolyl 4-hydroxylase